VAIVDFYFKIVRSTTRMNNNDHDNFIKKALSDHSVREIFKIIYGHYIQI